MTPDAHVASLLAALAGHDGDAVRRRLADPAVLAHLDALTDAADSADEPLRSAGLKALFAGLVEPLNDSFRPAGRTLYAELFPRVVWRSASRIPVLAEALAAAGIARCEQLLERYQQVRQGSAGTPGSATLPTAPPDAIALLSRVTIGADILLASVALQRLRDRFPNARLHLIGDGKLQGLLGGMPGVVVEAVPYPRRGPLHERLAVWLAVRAAISRCGAQLVVAPDSRLDQLGILPVIEAERYLLWENLQTGSKPGSLAVLLDRWLASRLALPVEPARLPRLALDAPTAELSQRLGLALGRGPWAAVKFDHGGNAAKALPRAAELAILGRLQAQGWRVLLDRGFGAPELANSDALLVQWGQDVTDIDETGTGLGEPFTQASPGAWAGASVVRFHGSIAGWAALVCQCRLALSYDSVGHHLAAAAAVPVVVAFTGYADPAFPVAWQPLGAAPVTVISLTEDEKGRREGWQRVLEVIPHARDAHAPRECP